MVPGLLPARWRRFVAGSDRLNPHRLLLHPVLDAQVGVLLPQRASEFRSGADAVGGGGAVGSPQRGRHLHFPVAQSANCSLPDGTSGGGGGGGPYQRPAMLTTTTQLPSIPATNAYSQHRRDLQIGDHMSPNRRTTPSPITAGDSPGHRGRGLDRVPLAPERIQPDALRPFQHQQIPLSQLRGQRAAAPFFTDEAVSPFRGGGVGGSGSGGGGAQHRAMEPPNPNFAPASAAAVYSSNSPSANRAGGRQPPGGNSTWAPTQYTSVASTIAKLMGPR